MPGRVCRRMRHLFSAFLQNELTPYHRQQIEEHLAGCEGCREEIHLLQLSLSSLQYLERIPVPSGFRASVRRQIVGQVQTTERCSRKSWLKGLAGAAIGAFILGLGISGWWWNSGKSWNRSPKNSLRKVTQLEGPLTTPRKDISSSKWMSRKISSNPLNIGKREGSPKAQAPPFPYPPKFTKTRPLRTQSSPQQVSPAGYSNRIPHPAESDYTKLTVHEAIAPLEAMLQHAAQVRENSRALALPQESISSDRPRGIPQTEPAPEEAKSEENALPEADQETGKTEDELPGAGTE